MGSAKLLNELGFELRNTDYDLRIFRNKETGNRIVFTFASTHQEVGYYLKGMNQSDPIPSEYIEAIYSYMNDKSIMADNIVDKLNEWAKEAYPNADNVKFEYRDTKTVLGFYIEDESLFFEYHRPTDSYEQYDSDNVEFTVPFNIVSDIIQFIAQEIKS